MALPPKGDPERPVHLAIRSTRILGVMLILLGSCALTRLADSARVFGFGHGEVLFGAETVVVYLAPGVLYLLCSVHLKLRQRRALMVALVLAATHLTLAMSAIVMAKRHILDDFVLNMVETDLAILRDLKVIRFTYLPTTEVQRAVAGVFAIALAQMIYHLWRSLRALSSQMRGFEVTSAPMLDEESFKRDSKHSTDERAFGP